jgi:uncharacterized protein
MLYRTMPKSDDHLSILGFGCMRFPQVKGKIDEVRSTAQIESAIENGINYFDTAFPYHMGASEPFLGKVLSGGLRDRVYVATKLPPWSIKTAEDMDRILDIQRSKLQTEYIDYYMIHTLNRTSWRRLKELGVYDFLERAKQDGRIRHTGFYFHGEREVFPEIIDDYDWTFCQIQYNYLDINFQAGTLGLKHAAKKNVGVIVMEPLRGGNLAKTPPKAIQEIWDESDIKRTPAEWALRWIWDHPEVCVVLSGMTEESNIEENLRIAADAHPQTLTSDEGQLVERAQKNYHKLMKAGCTGCGYCMPCPSGVDIPTCLKNYNDYHLFDKSENAKMLYFQTSGITGGKPSYASLCNECGECIEQCPQQLPIPDLLKEVTKDFEGWTFKWKIRIFRIMIVVQRFFMFRAK